MGKTRTWLNSIKRITSDTRASLSSLLMRVMTACVSKESSWFWYTWVCCLERNGAKNWSDGILSKPR